MSIFNKGLRAFSSAPSFFNKSAGFARSIFNKAPSALRGISGGLGQASHLLFWDVPRRLPTRRRMLVSRPPKPPRLLLSVPRV